mgnify:CR=1 FL=1
MAMQRLISNVRFFDKIGGLMATGDSFGRGALMIAASGNESDREGNRFHLGSFALEAAYPSAAEDFLSIGALTDEGKLAPFSNKGAKFLAPGVDITSAGLSASSALVGMSGTDRKSTRLNSSHSSVSRMPSSA